VQGEPRITVQIGTLAGVGHQAKDQFAALEGRLDPKIRGEPSARKVASALRLWASNSARTRCANPGAARSTSCHVVRSAMVARWPIGLDLQALAAPWDHTGRRGYVGMVT
jgi:hypothetical protein